MHSPYVHQNTLIQRWSAVAALSFALCCGSAAAQKTNDFAAPKGVPAPVAAALKQAGLPASSMGLYVQEVSDVVAMDEPRTQAVLASLNDDKHFVLASTTKVVTTLAALDLLGANYRWRTYAFASGPIYGGRLRGDLLIVGGGNSYLSAADLAQWFADLRAKGLKEISGNIVLDRFAFQLNEDDHAHTPIPGADRPHHARPDALTLNEGVLRVVVSPGTGQRAAVRLDPPLADVQLVNNVSMGGASCWAGASLSANKNALKVTVNGTWSKLCPQKQHAVAAMSHIDLTTRAVAALWQQAGGVLKGQVVDKPRPVVSDAQRGRPQPGPATMQRDAQGEALMPFAVHLSDRLPQVMRVINKTSDNMAARNLLLTLSQGFPFKAATLPAAQARMRQWLARQGLQPGDVEVENGSGLSRAERGKPRAMVTLLRNAWRSRTADAFVESLPIAGVDGTLAHRMMQGAATGQAFLKTGTLRDTRALAGYVRGRSGKVYAVAAMVNHPQATLGLPALDALIEWVAKNG
ncbi:MAG: D-alanyl-D-alanine carboxypeptidase/D-alanyl-D-alanine-endopeptidase [Pseudomonadota bacterium]|jgi:D-alanyl-D-alanine carboxypeptidase/D-alanyl-D-alanine-endopeptidase (penicillin-binding protein 4)